jgi:hypothetical protein
VHLGVHDIHRHPPARHGRGVPGGGDAITAARL